MANLRRLNKLGMTADRAIDGKKPATKKAKKVATKALKIIGNQRSPLVTAKTTRKAGAVNKGANKAMIKRQGKE